MRLSTRSVVAFTLAVAAVCSVSAQDIHLSQYDAPPMYLNPALTGKFNGRLRVHGHYRSQWKSIANNPFLTTALSGDMPFTNSSFAIGAQIMNQRAGEGNYNVFSFLVSGAYTLLMDSERGHRFSIGLQAGVMQKSVDFSRLTFDSQYTTANGGGFDVTLPNGENFTSQSFTIPDFNAGLLYYYAGESSRFNPFAGVSAFHLNQPNESFFSKDNTLPMRYLVHGGIKLSISERLQFTPKAWTQLQTNDKEITASLVTHYYLRNSDTYLIFAPTYRNEDAAILELGMKYKDYIVRISYDINTSSLKPTTSGRGGLEISLTWIADKKRPDPVPNCPRL